jgi:hypothetical protein
MKEIFWVIDLIGKMEEIARKTKDLDTEENLKKCIQILKDKLL